MARFPVKPAKPADLERQVTINGKFVRDNAREALHRFFRPLTAPFEKDHSEVETQKRQA
jgi:hypothetical protein